MHALSSTLNHPLSICPPVCLSVGPSGQPVIEVPRAGPYAMCWGHRSAAAPRSTWGRQEERPSSMHHCGKGVRLVGDGVWEPRRCGHSCSLGPTEWHGARWFGCSEDQRPFWSRSLSQELSCHLGVIDSVRPTPQPPLGPTCAPAGSVPMWRRSGSRLCI